MTSPTTDRRLGLAGNTAYKTPATSVATTPIVLSGEQTVNGAAVKAVNAAGVPDRVLVTAQADATQNGLWDVSTAAWTRSIDANGNYDWVGGTQVLITQGNGTLQNWGLQTTGAIAVGTTALVFVLLANIGFSVALASTAGADLVGSIQSLAGAVGMTLQTRARLEVWSKDFGHDPTASAAANDAALLAAITAVYNAGGGTIRVAAGVFQHITVPYNWSASRSVNISGAGQKATYLQKSGATTTPVLDLSVDIGVLDIYTSVSDLTIVGNAKAHHGLRATRLASITTRDLGIQACDVGFESVGCLVAIHERPEWQSNNIGFRCRKSTVGGNIFCNLVSFKGGSIRGNSTFGVDIGDASGVSYDGTKIDLNGTAANTATGGAMIRSTVADENGFAQLLFSNTYFESNLGRTFQTENVAGTCDLTLINVLLLNAETSRSANIGVLHNVSLINVQAPAAGDTVVIGAGAASYIEGGVINTITDSSTQQVRILNGTSAGLTPATFKTLGVGTGGLTVDSTAKVKGGNAYTDNATYMTFQDGAAAGNVIEMSCTNGAGGNAAGASIRLGRSGTTSRSINAGGTVNVNGADYAEYETKAQGCGLIAKGDIVGFDAHGLLTDRFDDAVSFGVKSTEPSYVGGDNWFTEQRPADEDEWPEFEQRLEVARQKVDRIAYAGKVPVNAEGLPGQWINAAAGPDGSIVGAASATADSNSVGRVLSVGADGRPVVKVL